MKYRCKVCGSIIDNNRICPYCGSDSFSIEKIVDDEPIDNVVKENNAKYKCLACGNIIDNPNHCEYCGADNNYIIEEKEQIPTIQVGNYVNYSGYTWKVISKNDSTYKLATTTLLTDANGQVYTRSYGNRTSEYNPKTYGSLAYYLNRTWYRTLDSSLIVDGVWNIGNYQVEGITDYKNIYTNTVTAKVGLLSVGEMYSLELPNTWLLTSLNEEDGMVYTVQEGNKYYSDVIDSEYGIRPAIYITNQVKIISGSGVLSDPYVIGGM